MKDNRGYIMTLLLLIVFISILLIVFSARINNLFNEKTIGNMDQCFLSTNLTEEQKKSIVIIISAQPNEDMLPIGTGTVVMNSNKAGGFNKIITAGHVGRGFEDNPILAVSAEGNILAELKTDIVEKASLQKHAMGFSFFAKDLRVFSVVKSSHYSTEEYQKIKGIPLSKQQQDGDVIVSKIISPMLPSVGASGSPLIKDGEMIGILSSVIGSNSPQVHYQGLKVPYREKEMVSIQSEKNGLALFMPIHDINLLSSLHQDNITKTSLPKGKYFAHGYPRGTCISYKVSLIN